jgi:hypothetical protein
LEIVAARQVYNSYQYLDASLRTEDFKGASIEELAIAFYDRKAQARASIPDEQRDVWTNRFLTDVSQLRHSLLGIWEAKWPEICDGKKLISDLHKKSSMRISESVFKARIVRGMRDAQSETWRLVRDILSDFLKQ